MGRASGFRLLLSLSHSLLFFYASLSICLCRENRTLSARKRYTYYLERDRIRYRTIQ